jgi:hypothetical protein
MEYLTQEDVTMIFKRWLTRRVSRIKEPTKFLCALCSEPGFGKYLHVCTDETKPENCIFICEFDVDNSDDFPETELIRSGVEKQWHLLSEIKRSDYESELKEAQENTY